MKARAYLQLGAAIAALLAMAALAVGMWLLSLKLCFLN